MFAYPRQDAVAGIVVSLVALPLCLGIAVACGVTPVSGLIAGAVGGLVVPWLSRSPLSVTGPAAGLTSIVLAEIALLGSFELFLTATIIAGILQALLGVFKSGRYAALVPSAVLIQVGLNLCKPALFSSQVKLGWTQLAPFALTIMAVLALDLLQGVIVGSFVGIGFVLFQNSRGALEQERAPNGALVLRFRRDGTFLSKPGIIAALDAIPEGERVVIDGSGEYIDHDVKEVLASFLSDAPRRNILATVNGIDLSMASAGGEH